MHEAGDRAAVADNPGACQELCSGKRLACVVVDVARTAPEDVEELLVEAQGAPSADQPSAGRAH